MKTNSRIKFDLQLEEEGFSINTHRFPYTYHHDYVRRGSLSRADTAQKLRTVCVDDNQYDFSACYGAILYLISEQPEKITERICDILKYVRAGSVYNVDGVCGLDRMRTIINMDA